MAANPAISGILVTLVLSTVFSGCFADDSTPSSDPNASSSTTAAATLGNSTDPGANQTVSEPPVANFTVSVFNSTDTNMTAGADLIFNASASSDPAGGELTYEWQFGDNATGEGITSNHTFATPGNYTVVLTVTSSESGLAGTTNQTLSIIAAAPAIPQEVKITDPSGDAAANYLDLRSVSVKQDEANLIITVGLAAVQPQSSTDTVFIVHFTLNKVEFEIYSYANGGLKLYDVTNSATVAGVVPRLAGTGYETKIPFEVLEGKKIKAPYAVFAETWIGEGFAGGVESDDRAPNTGTFSYG